MMMKGRVRAALRFLSDNSDKGLLSLNDTVGDASGNTIRDVLEEKHPCPGPVHPEALVEDRDDDNFHPVIYDGITAESIRTAALQTQGAAGPSGLDALNWRRLCTAFGQKSQRWSEWNTGQKLRFPMRLTCRICACHLDNNFMQRIYSCP